ncbi:hypothetical protein SGPA1_20788 [Streptomyces misionensis JCM 4497]
MYRPYLRGFGDTRFQGAGRLRSGQTGAPSPEAGWPYALHPVSTTRIYVVTAKIDTV